jgi:hypothetical protein
VKFDVKNPKKNAIDNKLKGETFSKNSFEYAQNVLARTKEEIARADYKTSFFLTVFLAFFTALISLNFFKTIPEYTLIINKGIVNEVIFSLNICSIIFACSSIFTLFMVVIPRLSLEHRNKNFILKAYYWTKDIFAKRKVSSEEYSSFFGQIEKFESAKSYLKSFKQTTEEHKFNELLEQIYINSCIAKTKYRYFNISMITFVFSVSLFMITIIIVFIRGGV